MAVSRSVHFTRPFEGSNEGSEDQLDGNCGNVGDFTALDVTFFFPFHRLGDGWIRLCSADDSDRPMSRLNCDRICRAGFDRSGEEFVVAIQGSTGCWMEVLVGWIV